MLKKIKYYQWVVLLMWLGLSAGFAQAATDCNQVTEIPVSECQSLLEFYNSTNGANWTNNTGWNQSNTPCRWFGVTCGEGHVQKLSLDSNQLSGRVPNFSRLDNLGYLSLSKNELYGSVPNLDLPKLYTLALYANRLTGNIPDFTNLPNLLYLLLSSNQLSGSIPDFTNLPNLKELYLGVNQLSGNIPNFSNLPKLNILLLRVNQLSGSIPNFNLPNLIELHLDSNQLGGSIPNFNLPNLQYLNLRRNFLYGSVPNFTFFNLANLKFANFLDTIFSENCGLVAYDAAQEFMLNQLDPSWKTRNPNCPVYYNLTLNKTGNGSISIGGSFTANSTVNLSATPDAGWMFDGWSPSPCNSLFQMPANDLTCIAKFSPLIKTLSLSKIGNGRISGGGNFTVGSTVNLSAIPDAGWRFGGWSPSPCNSSFQMPATDLSCTADFVQIIGDLQFKSERCKNSPLETFDGCYEEDAFSIGNTLKVTLDNKVITNRYQRVDLWVAIQLPSGDFLFMTSSPFNRFKFMDSHYTGEAFMPNLEAAERTTTIFEFDVPLNFGGKYTFYALYVALGKNPLLHGESVWLSNLTIKEINLANR